MKNVTDNFTVEEIFLILSCNTNNKGSAVQILKTYLNDDAGMNEIIQHSIDKLQKVSEQDFIELISYQI